MTLKQQFWHDGTEFLYRNGTIRIVRNKYLTDNDKSTCNHTINYSDDLTHIDNDRLDIVAVITPTGTRYDLDELRQEIKVTQETKDYFDDAGQALYEFSCIIFHWTQIGKIVVDDSRDLPQIAIKMAHDFHKEHSDTDWAEEDFLQECDDFFTNNIENHVELQEPQVKDPFEESRDYQINENVYELTSMLWMDKELIDQCEDTGEIRHRIITLAEQIQDKMVKEAKDAGVQCMSDFFDPSDSYYDYMQDVYEENKYMLADIEPPVELKAGQVYVNKSDQTLVITAVGEEIYFLVNTHDIVKHYEATEPSVRAQLETFELIYNPSEV